MNAFADGSHKCFRVTECLSDFLLMYLLRHEYPFFFALNLLGSPYYVCFQDQRGMNFVSR